MSAPPIGPNSPWLAPLAGYSDLPFRMLARRHGCAVACTEMVSCKGLVYGAKSGAKGGTKGGGGGTERLCATRPDDDPVVLQLFGGEPDFYAPAMDRAMELGFTRFDLNAGCPVRKVTKTGAGARLLEAPDRLVAIAREMVRRAGPGNVGVKTRLGWNMGEDVFLDVARRLEGEGVAWLTLHPRYGRQMFAGKADWTRLAELKAAVSLPVIASGDLFTAQDGVDCIAASGVDGVMYARGALYDPAIFARHAALMRGEPLAERTGEELAATVREHIRLTREHMGDPRSFRHIRSLIPRYAKGLRDIRTLRQRLLACKDWDELLEEAGGIAELEPVDAPQPDFKLTIST